MEKIYTVVDAGNTQIKIVDFKNDEILQFLYFPYTEKTEITNQLESRKNHISIFSSVLNRDANEEIIEKLMPNLILNNSTELPISLAGYQTPETLGADRIANAVAASYFSSHSNALVIDMGTCITFDLIENKIFQGGSISPGIHLRLRAMHEFTGTLPLLEAEKPSDFIGKSTKDSMLSGVFNGIQAEIIKFVHFYKEKYSPLTIFLTGGDHEKFENNFNCDIFVDKNFTVKGLYLILKHNV